MGGGEVLFHSDAKLFNNINPKGEWDIEMRRDEGGGRGAREGRPLRLIYQHMVPTFI